MAVDVAADRESVAVAVAGISKQSKRLAVLTHTIESVSGGAVREIAALVAQLGPARLLADRRAGAGALIDALAIGGVPVEEVTAGMLVTHCGAFFDAVTAGEIEHDSQPRLDAAAEAAISRQLGDAWAWDRRRSIVELSPLLAATHAVGAYRATYGESFGSGIH